MDPVFLLSSDDRKAPENVPAGRRQAGRNGVGISLQNGEAVTRQCPESRRVSYYIIFCQKKKEVFSIFAAARPSSCCGLIASNRKKLDHTNSKKTLDRYLRRRYNIYALGVWRSLVSRLVRVQEAVGSNPATPTKKEKDVQKTSFSFLVSYLSGGIRKGRRRSRKNVPVDGVGDPFARLRSPGFVSAGPPSTVLRVSSFSPRDPFHWARVGSPLSPRENPACTETRKAKENED